MDRPDAFDFLAALGDHCLVLQFDDEGERLEYGSYDVGARDGRSDAYQQSPCSIIVDRSLRTSR